jgi:hypothetical protein
VPFGKGLTNGISRLSQSLGQTLGQIQPIWDIVMMLTIAARTITMIVGIVLLVMFMDCTLLYSPLQTPN